MAAVYEQSRRFPRDSVSGVRVQLPLSGKVVDASSAGIAIEATESLRPGWSYAFKMTVGPNVVSIPGKVAWCRRVGTRESFEGKGRPVYKLGVALVGSIWNKRRNYIYP